MIATLVQATVMRSAVGWSFDVRLLSFAREGEEIRGLLVLKTGWGGFHRDGDMLNWQTRRRLYCVLLWRFRFNVPIWRDRAVA